MRRHRPRAESVNPPSSVKSFYPIAPPSPGFSNMFTRPRFSHPYKASPAGFRIADYLARKPCFNLFTGLKFNNRFPVPTPFNSPTKGHCLSEDDAPPTIRLADQFARDGFGTPERPSTPTPDHIRNETPNVDNIPGQAQDPSLDLPRLKVKHGRKHLSFTKSGHIRPDTLPPHRRAQQLREKRDVARKRIFQRHGRRTARARGGLASLRKEAETLMEPQHMNEQDKIFLQQLRKLQLDDEFQLGIERCRQRVFRAADESEERKRAHEQRDEEAEKLWGETQGNDAKEEQERLVAEFVRAKEEEMAAHDRQNEEAAMRADEERQRAHDARERRIREKQELFFRQEMARKAKDEAERRRREEEQRRIREEWERRVQQERERRLREEMERARREARQQFLREQRERQQREEWERLLREDRERKLREEIERMRREAQERERLAREEQRARLLAEEARRVALEEQVRRHFALYEAKWTELRTNNSIPPINVQEIPWPVFCVISSVDQITYEDVRSFLFHPQRPGVEGKTARDKVKSEVLRFHPDKFNARVVPKIQPAQQDIAQEIAGAVARILTRILTEEEKK